MSQPPRAARGASKLISSSEWLYTRLLRIYPPSFQQAYASRMVRVFRDSCRDAVRQRSSVGLLWLWLQMLSDLLTNACLERWLVFKEGRNSMATNTSTRLFPLRLWWALSATLLAFMVSLIASFNLYQLEDSSSLTTTAYSASPLLRFSYDAIYLSALTAGIAVCALVGYALINRERLVLAGSGGIALLVLLGGFGGLLVRQPVTFLALAVAFCLLLLLSFLGGRAVAVRAGRRLSTRAAAVLGACVSAGILLLINGASLVLHTLLLNPVSHNLYMQGQITGTHLNFSLIAMGLATLTLLACMLSLGLALRLPARS
ncbi:MAG TPA: hypothetical protein VGD98_00350 [Ktedonobacteraceae bacterium]